MVCSWIRLKTNSVQLIFHSYVRLFGIPMESLSKPCLEKKKGSSKELNIYKQFHKLKYQWFLRVLPPSEIDLPEGDARVAEAGGLGFEPRLVIPCKIGYNAWIYCLCPLGLLYRSTWLGRQVAFLEIRKFIPGL